MQFAILCIGGNFPQRLYVDCAGSTSLHLLEVVCTADVAHEEKTFQRLYIRPRGYHVHGYGDSRIVFVAELGEYAFRIFFRLISHLLAEIVAFAKDLTDDFYNVVCMRIILGEYQGLRHTFARTVREQLCKQDLSELADNSPYLALVHNPLVEVLALVRKVVI